MLPTTGKPGISTDTLKLKFCKPTPTHRSRTLTFYLLILLVILEIMNHLSASWQ